MRRRKGEHAAARKWGLPAWRTVLSAVLVLVLAVSPLPAAYGADASDVAPMAGETPTDPVAGADELAVAGGEGCLEPADPIAQDDASEAGVTVELDSAVGQEPEGGDAVGQPEEAIPSAEESGASADTADGMDAEAGSDADAAVANVDDGAEADADEDGQGPQAGQEPETAQDGASVAADPAIPEAADGVEQVAPVSAPQRVASAKPVSPTGAANAEVPAATGSTTGYQPNLDPISGAISLLAIVVGFSGADGAGAVPSDDSYDWAQTIFTSEDGVSAFYRDMSNGAFTFVPAAETSAYRNAGNTNKADAENDGIVHVNLPEAHGNWADAYDDVKVAGAMLACFSRALVAADAYVDFARYDADADGKLDPTELAIAFVVAGYEEASVSGSLPAGSYSLRAHAWSYSDAGFTNPELDGVMLDKYVALAEKMPSDDGKDEDVQEPLSVLMHELGHYLGLPDLYDTAGGKGDWAEHSVGQTSLMADGEWATAYKKGKTVYSPTALDAWSRYELGWVKPTVVKKGGVYTVSAQDSKSGYSALLVPTANKGEYYLIENRTFTGHDVGLSDGCADYRDGGLVIWHIDNGVVERCRSSNQVNGSKHRPGVMPLFPETDGKLDYSLSYASTLPERIFPFWTSGLFKEWFGSEKYLDLPLYGTGENADDPDARTLSGIRIEFLDDAGMQMRIRIIMPGEEEPEDDGQTEDEEPVKSDTVEPVNCDIAIPVQEAAVHAAAEVAYGEAPAAGRIPATGDEPPSGVLFTMLASALLALYARTRRNAVQPRHARRFV